MRRDDLCNFCEGHRRFFYLKHERPALWKCTPCRETGVSRPMGPATLRIGPSQGRFLKPYPETSP